MTRALLLAAFTLGAAGFDRPAAAADLKFNLFKRRPAARQDPGSRVQALVATLQTDPDADKRKAAAEELRGLDPRTTPEVIPALVGALQRDPSVAVRTQAVESIGRLKPVSQSAGLALEAALAADPDPKVREAVQSALWQYHLNGYRTAAGTPLTSQTPEPPFAPRRPVTSTSAKPPTDFGGPVLFRPITNGVGKAVAQPSTLEPPLARPRVTPAPAVPPAATPAPTLPVPPAATPEPAAGIPLPAIPVAPVEPATPRRNFYPRRTPRDAAARRDWSPGGPRAFPGGGLPGPAAR